MINEVVMHGAFDGEEFGQTILEAIKSYLDRRCAALETKIALLEQRSFSYQGVWKVGTPIFFTTHNSPATAMRPGHFVSDVASVAAMAIVSKNAPTPR
jgi:hypothetical protein